MMINESEEAEATPITNKMNIDCDLKRLYYLNRSLHNPWHSIYAGLYIILTFTSLLSNLLLLMALYRFNNKRLRHQNRLSGQNLLIRPLKPGEITRDRLISHLAILDIFLSLTIPMTAFDGLSKFWPLGRNTEVLCQLTKSSPSIVVYSSSMLIILIAVNCYRQIIVPHKMQLSPNNLKYITIAIVFLATLFTIPQFYHTKLFDLFVNSTDSSSKHLRLPTTSRMSFAVHPTVTNKNISFPRKFDLEDLKTMENENCNDYDKFGWSHVVFCIEEWPFGEEFLDPKGRLNYSIFTFASQMIIPLFIISYCYQSVYRKLQNHYTMRRTITNYQREEKVMKETRRCNRRNKQITIISLVYVLSWLPLGSINLLLDSYPDVFGKDMSHVTMVVLTCHLIGMCSAIANPVIYGYTNKHIRKGILIISNDKLLEFFLRLQPSTRYMI